MAVCKAMLETEILPDFVVVDGAEGGTGAAPLEMSDHLGSPLREGLVLVQNALVGAGVRDKIKIGVRSGSFEKNPRSIRTVTKTNKFFQKISWNQGYFAKYWAGRAWFVSDILDDFIIVISEPHFTRQCGPWG